MDTKQETFYRGWGIGIGFISVLIVAIAAGWLIWNELTDIRYSADHQGTIPIWSIWVPVLVCIVLTRVMSMRLPSYNPIGGGQKQQLTIQSIIFFLGAILFSISILLVDHKSSTFQLWYIGLKLAFLLLIPWILVRIFQSESMSVSKLKRPRSLSRWMWASPLLITGVWVYLTYFSVFSASHPPSNIAVPMTMLIILLFGFLINSLLEELFYRVWLQTRLERLIGAWPAIFLTSILWSIWHIAIQNTGQWSIDVATVISNQGVTGLFLGYLWSRYRKMWILILIHGIMNAPPYLLIQLWNM